MIMSDSQSTNQSQVKVLFKDIKSSVLNYESFRNELKEKKLSGECVIHSGKLTVSLLFLRGTPIIDSNRLGVSQTLSLIQSPNTILDFFILGDNLALAYSSAMNGKSVWNSPSTSKEQIQKVLSFAQKKQMTGHLGIFGSNGHCHRLLIHNGKSLGIFNPKIGWNRIEPKQALKNGKKMEFFLAVDPDRFFDSNVESKSVVPEPEKKSSTNKDLELFLHCWNLFTSQLANKVGENLVKKSMNKHFGDLTTISVRGIHLKKMTMPEELVTVDLDIFSHPIQLFLKSMVDISGKRWMHNKLLDCAQEHPQILNILNLHKIFTA